MLKFLVKGQNVVDQKYILLAVKVKSVQYLVNIKNKNQPNEMFSKRWRTAGHVACALTFLYGAPTK